MYLEQQRVDHHQVSNCVGACSNALACEGHGSGKAGREYEVLSKVEHGQGLLRLDGCLLQ